MMSEMLDETGPSLHRRAVLIATTAIAASSFVGPVAQSAEWAQYTAQSRRAGVAR